MSEYAVSINLKSKLNENDESLLTLILDNVDDTSIQDKSTITTYPVPSGDIIADHIYKDPITLKLSGIFSLNGSKGIIVENDLMRLSNLSEIQNLFTKIKNEGILCDIIKVHMNVDKNILFQPYSDMVLQSISWTEKINTVTFDFSFTQVLLSDILEIDVDVTDSNLPEVVEPVMSNFTDVIMNANDNLAIIIQSLKNEGLMSDEFWKGLGDYLGTMLVADGVTVLGSILLTTTILQSVPVAGQVGGVLILASAIIALGISSFIKRTSARRYRYKAFDKYPDDVERFGKFVEEINESFTQLNNYIKVYKVSSEKTNQDILLNIDDGYYFFRISKDNVSNEEAYYMEVVDYDGNPVANSKKQKMSTAKINFSELTSSNAILTTFNNTKAYLLCPSEDKTILTNYYILTSTINPEDYINIIKDIIEKSILR